MHLRFIPHPCGCDMRITRCALSVCRHRLYHNGRTIDEASYDWGQQSDLAKSDTSVDWRIWCDIRITGLQASRNKTDLLAGVTTPYANVPCTLQ